MVLRALVHVLVQFLDVITQKTSLNWSQITDSRLVTTKKLVELVNIAHVVLLLKSNIDDGLRNWLADTAQELGFTNGDSELWRKVHFVNVILIALFLAQDVLLEVLDGLVGILITPLVEDLFLVLFVKFLGKFDIHGCHIFELVTVKLLSLGLELSDWSLNSTHDRTSPSDATGIERHVLRDRRVIFSSFESLSSVVEQFFHDFKLFLILVEHIIVLLLQLVLDRLSCPHILEFAEEVKGRLGRIQLLGESLINERVDSHVNIGDVAVKAFKFGGPLRLVRLLKHVSWELFKLSYLIFDLVDLLIDFVSTSGNLLQIWSKDGEELLNDCVRFCQILQDVDHVLRLGKDFFEGLEVPLLHSLLVFDFLLGVEEFLAPFLKYFNALSDELDGLLWLFHLEDLRDVDLSLDFVTNLVGNTSQDLLELRLLSVDVSRDGPNELEAGEQGWQGLLNQLQLTLLDVAELPI